MQYINVATEDDLSEAVARRLISDLLPNFTVHLSLGRNGNGYLRTKFQDFNQMALRVPVFLITDLDNTQCPSLLVDNWRGNLKINNNLKFRVAVREIESWVLADHDGMKVLLEKGANKLPPNPDEIANPKEYLLNCARKAPRYVRSDLLAVRGTLAVQGLGYNTRLCAFVETTWSPLNAAERSDSLARAIKRLSELEQQ